MKRNTAWNWRIGMLMVGAVAMAVGVGGVEGVEETAASEPGSEVSQGPPAPPEGDRVSTPPAIPALTPPPLNVSAGMEDIFRMARSGVSDEVLSAFVAKSGRAYHPTPDEIIYLKDLGVEPGTIAAIIETGTGKTERVQEIADGNFRNVESLAGPQGSDVSVAEKDGQTTVNVTTHNHYAVAPQPQDGEAAPGEQPSAQTGSGEEVSIEYFQGALAPYGSWVYVQGVGNCWRPTVAIVNANWRPYYDGGRWIYTDTGWYWLSDYSWGWAPFHYGRWTMSASYGWVWAPGYQWGPGWVSWRRTPTYCGWAPLPAYYYGGGVGFGYGYYGSGWGLGFGISWGSYNWVPNRYCYGYYPRYYGAPHGRKQEIYQNSTVIKPTIIGDNNTIIINGPNATTIAKASNTEIRRVKVRNVTNLRDPGPKDYIENGGQTLATFRPTVRPARNGDSTGGITPETRRGTVASTPTSGTPVAATGLESRRNTPALAGSSTTSRSPTRSATSQAGVSRQTTSSAATASAESVRNSGSSWSTQQTTPRVAGQNTTIQPNPSYRTPAVQSTPILRDGRSIQYNAPVRHTPPVVAGGISTETRRPSTTYSYPGSTAVFSSGQTVRTPTLSRSTTLPSTQGIQSYSPLRQPTSSHSSPAQVETSRSRSFTPSPSYTAPTTSRMTIPASRPPTRSYSPARQSYSRPSAPSPRQSISSTPSRAPSAPAVSRPSSSPSSRAPSARPSTSGGSSRAPGRR